MTFSAALGSQLRNPSGFAGRLTGRVMGVANRRPNSLAIAALRIQPGDQILELGFGPGCAIRAMSALAPLGTIYGVDNSRVMLDQARRRNGRAIRVGHVVLYWGQFDALPLPDASVDGILAVNVVYFWNDAGAVMREIRRVLRPGGRVSIYATDLSAMQNWTFASHDTHLCFDANGLGSVLSQGGFERGAIQVRDVRITRRIKGLVATISG